MAVEHDDRPNFRRASHCNLGCNSRAIAMPHKDNVLLVYVPQKFRDVGCMVIQSGTLASEMVAISKSGEGRSCALDLAIPQESLDRPPAPSSYPGSMYEHHQGVCDHGRFPSLICRAGCVISLLRPGLFYLQTESAEQSSKTTHGVSLFGSLTDELRRGM